MYCIPDRVTSHSSRSKRSGSKNSAILVLLILLSAIHLHEKIYKHTIVGIIAALLGIIALSL